MPAARPRSLVTGASSGIGAAFARQLAARGHDLVLTARRADRLEGLARQLAPHSTEVVVLPADLADVDGVRMLVRTIEDRGLAIDWLVNNAGYGVPGSFGRSDWATHEAFLRVMVATPAELVWRLLPGMRERGYGRIVNVASLAGLVPGSAGHTLYAASKAQLIKFSQSLALENTDRDIHVCALCPGFTRSEFHDVTGTRARVEAMPGFLWMDADEVVRQGIVAVERGTVVWVPGGVNRLIKGVMKLLPDAWALKLSARQSHRYRNPDR